MESLKSGLLGLFRIESVKLRNQPITPKDKLRIVAPYESGPTIKQVKERIGYSYGIIRRVIHENGTVVRFSAIQKHLGSNEALR